MLRSGGGSSASSASSAQANANTDSMMKALGSTLQSIAGPSITDDISGSGGSDDEAKSLLKEIKGLASSN